MAGSNEWDEWTLHGEFPHLFPRPSAAAMLQKLRTMIDEDGANPPKMKPYVPMRVMAPPEHHPWRMTRDNAAPQPWVARGNSAKAQQAGVFGGKVRRPQLRPRAGCSGGSSSRAPTRPKPVPKQGQEVKQGIKESARVTKATTMQPVGPLGFSRFSRRRRKHFKPTLETIYEHRACFYCPMWRRGSDGM